MCAELKNSHLGELLLWLLRLRRRFRITGNSMTPLLKPGDEVLVNPRAYQRMPPKPGDIVVTRHPYRTDLRLVKRVATVLPDGRCLIEGDNPSESTDSRSFGPVAPKQILGQVTGRFP
ncbi:nickel-type superoxide dismutase maturation protease [Candidatus Poribacteria bacterium]|nr:nickel-type superoxide dismutase maturation protease [Candidatus Poribacteria bacterium]